MGSFSFSYATRLSWGDADQQARLKLPIASRLGWDGYSQYGQNANGMPRAEYFSLHGMAPVVTFTEIKVADHAVEVDVPVDMTFNCTVGFSGRTRRYGGVDTIAMSTGGHEMASLQIHWVWFKIAQMAVLGEPAPGTKVDQDTELPGPPPRPALDGAVDAGTFRWALRDTDQNQHVTTFAWLERAENAVADVGAAATPHRAARIWFRRPAFAGDAMVARVLAGTETVVDLAAAGGDTCCIVALS